MLSKLQQAAAGVATAVVMGQASAAGSLSTIDNEYGKFYGGPASGSCLNGQAAPKGYDARWIDNLPLEDKRVVIDADGKNAANNKSARATYYLELSNCRSIIVPQSQENKAFGHTVHGTERKADIMVGDAKFTNVYLPSGATEGRVWVNADLSSVNVTQNTATTISVRFTNSVGSPALTNVQNVGQICGDNFHINLSGNSAASQSVQGTPCPVGYSMRPL